MKIPLKLIGFFALALFAPISAAYAQLTIPSDGSDGDLNVTSDTTIDLSQAPAGAWASAGTGKGVYDASKWAVVFKYNSVSVAAGKTLSFKNNASRAPVVWLVKGNVAINGTVSLRGLAQEPGPGGFRGAYQDSSGVDIGGGGFGIGGGSRQQEGGYATSTGAAIYGNVQIVPLIGGSGGGRNSDYGRLGTGGGGAILIAATGTITVNGSVTAQFSVQTDSQFTGSGGAIRLIGSSVTGSGQLRATGNSGDGRIRIETNSFSSVSTFPSTVAVAPDSPPLIWPTASSPTIRVVSVDSIAVPADPKSNLDAAGADVLVNKTAPVTILLEATNFATTGKVTIRITRKYGDPITLTATLLDGGTPLSHWTATTTIPQGFSAIQAVAKP